MHRVLAGFYIALFFSVLSAAQMPFDAEGISALNVDDSMKGWKPVCVLPSCNPGGSGIPIRTSQTIDHLSPTKDGRSMEVSLTGRSYTNALWTYIAGHDDSATSFSMDLWVYTSGAATVA